LGADGVAVIDWRAIGAPEIKAVVATESPVRAVALRDRLGFVGLESGSVQVYSLGDLTAPRLVGMVALGSPALDFALDGTLLYIAAAESGLAIVETRRPAEPQVLGRLVPPLPGQLVMGVALEGGKRAYLSAGNALVIADVDVPGTPQLLAVATMPAQAAVARNFIVYAASVWMCASARKVPRTRGRLLEEAFTVLNAGPPAA
jgi:hypothetical protein